MIMTVWTVFFDPNDHPGKWVLRGFDVDAHGVQPRGECTLADTLDEIREALPPGLHCLGRLNGDEPAIYESWV